MNNDYSPEMHDLVVKDQVPEHRETFFSQLEDKLADEHGPKVATPISILRRHWVGLAATAAVAMVVVAALAATTTLTSSNTTQSKQQMALPSNTVTTPPVVQTTLTTSVPTTPPTTQPQITPPIKLSLAAQIGQRAAAEYAGVNSISATFTRTKPGENVEVRAFKATSSGNYWYSLAGGPTADTAVVSQIVSYNDATGSSTIYNVDSNSVVNETNIDMAGGMDYYGGFSLSNLLNGIALDNNANVVNAMLNGQKVWKIDAKFANPIIGLGDLAPTHLNEIVAYFDQKSLFPLQIEAGGYTTTLTNLQINPTFSADDFTVDVPSNVQKIPSYDGGSIRASLADIKKSSGKSILLPADIPDGFKPGPYTWNPQYGRFQISYHDGLQTFLYVIDFKGKYPSSFGINEDPFFNLNETNVTKKSSTVEGGKYDGVNATITTGPATRPHAAVSSPTSNLYVGGDITADDLITLIQSIDVAN